MELVLGIDLGTSYFKLGLFDRDGQLRGLGRVAVEAETEPGGRCELPVERFWAALRAGVAQALTQAKAGRADIKAIGYSSQANTFLLLDDNDAPLTPLILWTDTRAHDQTQSAEPGGDAWDEPLRRLWQRPDFPDITGLGISFTPILAAVKLRWLQRHRPRVWARTRRVQTLSDYLVYSLTGLAVGDEGTTPLLGLWDLRRHDWWADALTAAGLDRNQLSRRLPPGTVAGPITDLGAERLDLAGGVPLAVGSLDHHVAAIGAGVGHVAEVSESTGTVVACLRCVDEFPSRAGTCAGPGLGGRGYHVLAFDGNGAGALEWYQREHASDLTIEDLLALAEKVPPGCDGLTALPSANGYDGLEGFRGRGPRHGRGHFVRAILESTAGTLAELVDSLCPDDRPKRIVATGGGARSKLWLRMKAELIGAKFVVPRCNEPACLGAAMLAAAAAGWFEDGQQAAAAWSRCDLGG